MKTKKCEDCGKENPKYVDVRFILWNCWINKKVSWLCKDCYKKRNKKS